MRYNNYINPDFTSYLNRYCTGIIQLKDRIGKITVSFELTEAFGNHACRFCIDIDLIDHVILSADERRTANEFFYNSSNTTGSQFVSFIYMGQRDRSVDTEEIKAFIYHYKFAQDLFEGFIKKIIPETCMLVVDTLESEPFFNYMEDYISKSKDLKEEEKKPFFEKAYFMLTNRELEFDCAYHASLIKFAGGDVPEKLDTIFDIELSRIGGASLSNIRKFVVEKKVPFYIGYRTDVIDVIRIDAGVLLEKIKEYAPNSIHTPVVLELLERKRQEVLERERLMIQKCEQAGIHLGDYICIEARYHRSDDLDIGLIKEIGLDQRKELEVKYNPLKKNLTESLIQLQTTTEANISYSMNPDLFKEEISKGKIKDKLKALQLFKEKGVKNPLFIGK